MSPRGISFGCVLVVTCQKQETEARLTLDALPNCLFACSNSAPFLSAYLLAPEAGGKYILTHVLVNRSGRTWESRSQKDQLPRYLPI